MRPVIQSKKQNKNGTKVFFVFALLLIIFFSISPASFQKTSSLLNTIAAPFWHASRSSSGVFSPALFFQSKAELLKKNQDLKERTEVLARNLKGYDFAVQENLELKQLLFGKKENGVFAGILAHPGNLPFDTFLLDIGTEAGMQNDGFVLADQNVALGRIVEIHPYSSKVKGFSSSGEVTDSFLGPENIPVQIKGLGGGAFLAELPRDLDIREGDAAILPGSDGFILAYVESKEESVTDSFQKLYLRSPINIFEMKYVQVLRALPVAEEKSAVN